MKRLLRCCVLPPVLCFAGEEIPNFFTSITKRGLAPTGTVVRAICLLKIHEMSAFHPVLLRRFMHLCWPVQNLRRVMLSTTITTFRACTCVDNSPILSRRPLAGSVHFQKSTTVDHAILRGVDLRWCEPT